jgi:hypothetical protein
MSAWEAGLSGVVHATNVPTARGVQARCTAPNRGSAGGVSQEVVPVYLTVSKLSRLETQGIRDVVKFPTPKFTAFFYFNDLVMA